MVCSKQFSHGPESYIRRRMTSEQIVSERASNQPMSVQQWTCGAHALTQKCPPINALENRSRVKRATRSQTRKKIFLKYRKNPLAYLRDRPKKSHSKIRNSTKFLIFSVRTTRRLETANSRFNILINFLELLRVHSRIKIISSNLRNNV